MEIFGRNFTFGKVENKTMKATDDQRPRSGIKYQQTLVSTRQDISSWRSAMLAAESIHYPNRQQLYRLYKDVMLDAQITALITQRKNSILGSSFKVSKGEKEDEKKTELIQSKWFYDFISHSLDSIYYGYSLIQFGDMINDSFLEVDIVPREYVKQEFNIVVETSGQTTGLPYLEEPYATWSIGVGTKRDLGLLSKLAPLYIWKKGAMGAWAEYTEMFGTPIRIGKTDTRNEATRQNMENMLKNMGSSAYGVFDTEDLIELIESNKNGASDIFDTMIERCNSEIAKIILGQTGTTDSKSFVGAAAVHERVSKMYKEADEMMLENIFKYQLVPFLNKHGFGFEGYTIEVEEDDELSLIEKSKIDMELLKYYKIPAQYILEEYGTPVEDMPKEDVVKQVKNSLNEYYQ